MTQVRVKVRGKLMNDLAFKMSCVDKTYPHFQLSDINLELNKGCIMGFIGPNGAVSGVAIFDVLARINPWL